MKMCSRDIYLSFTVFSFYLHSLILLQLNKESRRSNSEPQDSTRKRLFSQTIQQYSDTAIQRYGKFVSNAPKKAKKTSIEI